MDFNLTDQEKSLLLTIARESISSYLEKRKPNYQAPTKDLEKPCGAFVTLTRHGKLRGCIGYMTSSEPLIKSIKELARASAFSDPRFPPVKMGELPDLRIEISVLSPLKKISTLEEIQVGEHGIYMKRGYSTGVLLPQVAVEQGWDRNNFLTHTCYKAGLEGNCFRDPKTEIFIFSALIFNEKSTAKA